MWCGVVWWHRAEGSALLHFLLSLETRSRAPHCQFPPSPDTGCHGDPSALEAVETNAHDTDMLTETSLHPTMCQHMLTETSLHPMMCQHMHTETSIHPTMYQHMHMHPSTNIVREHSSVHLAHQVASVSPILS